MTNDVAKPHIGISYPSGFPEYYINDIFESIKSPGLKIDIRKEEPAIFASVEWMVPTFFAVYLLKPYFESFLAEAGKDHYLLLKKGLKELAKRVKGIGARTIVSSQSPDKVAKNNDQSKIFSISIQTKSGRIIKLLFDNTLSEEDWDEAIDTLFEYVAENYNNPLQGKLVEFTEGFRKEEYVQYYVIIDKETKRIKFYDDMGIIKLHRENP